MHSPERSARSVAGGEITTSYYPNLVFGFTTGLRAANIRVIINPKPRCK